MNFECQLAFKAEFGDSSLRRAAPLRKRTVDVVAQLTVRLPRPRTNALDPEQTFAALDSTPEGSQSLSMKGRTAPARGRKQGEVADHNSWPNQIERFVSVFADKAIRRG
jgi:hypothetical protein